MSKAPAFMFYAGDYLSSSRVTLLSLEEEGAYIRLLAHCWLHGSIPSDPELIARLIGKGASTTLATKVQAMFKQGKNEEELVHDKLESIRSDRETWIAKSRAGGIASGEKRRLSKEKVNQTEGCLNHPSNHPSNQMPTTPVDEWLEPNANSSTSTSSSNIVSLSREREIPTKEEVLSHADRIGLASWKAEDWWLDMEAKEWHTGNTEIRQWRPALTRMKLFWEEDGKPMKRPGRAATGSGATMPDWKKEEVILKQLGSHPGNIDSVYYKQGDKAAKTEFRALKSTLVEIKGRQAKEALA